MAAARLTELERELLELCYLDSGGETTRALQVSLLAEPIQRSVLEATLRGLVDRRLMTSWRGAFVGAERDRAGVERIVDYVDDWWVVTDEGRAAIGVRPAAEARETFWLNPAKGAWRVPPVLAPWCRWRFDHGKAPLPSWLARRLGKELLGEQAHWHDEA